MIESKPECPLSRKTVKSPFELKIMVFLLVLPWIIISCTPSHEFTIIGTADLQGILEPTEKKIDGKKESVGGISRIGTLIKKIRAEKKKMSPLSPLATIS